MGWLGADLDISVITILFSRTYNVTQAFDALFVRG